MRGERVLRTGGWSDVYDTAKCICSRSILSVQMPSGTIIWCAISFRKDENKNVWLHAQLFRIRHTTFNCVTTIVYCIHKISQNGGKKEERTRKRKKELFAFNKREHEQQPQIGKYFNTMSWVCVCARTNIIRQIQNINLMTIFKFIRIISNSYRSAANRQLLTFFFVAFPSFYFGLFWHCMCFFSKPSKRNFFYIVFLGEAFLFIQNRILNSDPFRSDWIESNRIGLYII